MERDFVGYGGQLPRVEWPSGARIAISLCINVEEGSELSSYFGDDSQQPFGSESSARPPGVRSLASETLWEYGARAGGWRMLRLLKQEQVKATFFVCGMALEHNPPFARAITEEGHEVLGHGYRWIAQWNLDLDAERAYIHRAVEAIEQTTGQRPLGWFSRSGPSLNTRQILKEEGFLFDSESLNDDLPYYVTVQDEPWLVVPYAFDSNDSSGNVWPTAGDFCAYLKDSFDVLYDEGTSHPKMLSVGLHTKRSGKPGRIGAVAEFIRYAKSHPRVWFAGRNEIARWWWQNYPPARQKFQ
jgi:allantoinase